MGATVDIERAMRGLEDRLQKVVQYFWVTRHTQSSRQELAGKVDAGTRGAVTGGGHMAAFETLIADILKDTGIPDLTIKLGKNESSETVKAKKQLELPGYYRPEKRWDMIVLNQGRLLASIEFKAQVGPSFGNNFNNRAEEAIGSAEDLWKAFREKRFGDSPTPFLGYVFLLEDCPEVHSPVTLKEPFFEVDPIFKAPGPKPTARQGISYSSRYKTLCQRLVLERLYSATAFIISTKGKNPKKTEPDPALTFRRFVAALIGHISGASYGTSDRGQK